MLKNVLLLMPLLTAAMVLGCTQSEVASDEEFLESVRTEAESAAPTTYSSHTALQAGAAVPEIAFEVDSVVIEDVPYDGLGEAVVKVFNRGDGELQITNVATSCNCTVGRIDKKIVPPGGETELFITIYPNKIPGFEATRMLTISSNDPNMSDFGLPVTSYVTPELEVAPESMNLGAIQAGKGYDRHYVVRQLIDDPVNITAARSTQQYIDVTYSLRPEDQWAKPGHREYDLVLHVKPDAPVGRLDSRLALEVDLKRVPRLMFDITGVVHNQPYSIVPRTSIYSNVEPGDTLENAYTLTADEPITIGDFESDGDSFEISHRQGDSPNEVIFDLHVGPDVAEPRITQLWNFQFELGGKTYVEQLAARVSTTATMPESD